MSNLPCLRDDDSGEIIEPSDGVLFLWAIGKAPPDFDWVSIPPEDWPAWARRVLEWENKR